jgi:uncharacterized membrane-anchored protein YitT (DUF2179 family)
MGLKRFHKLWEVGLTLAGTGLLALGLHIFIAPNQIAPGGVSGLSIVLSYLTGAPIGLINLIINIPLLFLGFFALGRWFFFKTMLSVVSFTVFYDLIFPPVVQYSGNMILASLFGGVLIGTGIGLSFVAESSTGGFDISSKAIQKKFPYIPLGKIMFLTDVVVIGLSALVFQSVESAMYALIAMFVSSRVIDALIYGLDVGKCVWVISEKGMELGAELAAKLDRGVTVLPCTGAYSRKERQMLLCAVRQNEYHHLKRVIKEIDPNAFLIVTTATEVVGEGFKAIDRS